MKSGRDEVEAGGSSLYLASKLCGLGTPVRWATGIRSFMLGGRINAFAKLRLLR